MEETVTQPDFLGENYWAKASCSPGFFRIPYLFGCLKRAGNWTVLTTKADRRSCEQGEVRERGTGIESVSGLFLSFASSFAFSLAPSRYVDVVALELECLWAKGKFRSAFFLRRLALSSRGGTVQITRVRIPTNSIIIYSRHNQLWRFY